MVFHSLPETYLRECCNIPGFFFSKWWSFLFVDKLWFDVKHPSVQFEMSANAVDNLKNL